MNKNNYDEEITIIKIVKQLFNEVITIEFFDEIGNKYGMELLSKICF